MKLPEVQKLPAVEKRIKRKKAEPRAWKIRPEAPLSLYLIRFYFWTSTVKRFFGFCFKKPKNPSGYLIFRYKHKNSSPLWRAVFVSKFALWFGAKDGTWTHTGLLPLEPESSASANSATLANRLLPCQRYILYQNQNKKARLFFDFFHFSLHQKFYGGDSCKQVPAVFVNPLFCRWFYGNAVPVNPSHFGQNRSSNTLSPDPVKF